MLLQYISAFKNLSAIQLVYNLSRGGVPGQRSGPPELVWNDLKAAAISQLEGSCADGPKRLKTVVMWAGGEFEPEVETEEIIVHGRRC